MDKDDAVRQASLDEALFSALEADDAAQVRQLLALGASVNAHNERGCLPLYLAASCAGTECMTALVESGAALDARYYGQVTAFWVGSAVNAAIDGRRFDNAHLLLDLGASPNITNSNGGSALHLLAGQGGYSPAEPLLMLLDKLCSTGADITKRDLSGYLPLDVLVQVSGPAEVGAEMIRRGGFPSLPGRNGTTPLHHIWNGKNTDLLDVLMRDGADINIRDGRGRTPLFFAYDGAAVEAMVAFGADVFAIDDEGRQALAYAARTTWTPSLIAALLEAGLDPGHQDNLGQSVRSAVAAGTADNSRALAPLIAAHDARTAMRRAGRVASLQPQVRVAGAPNL